MTSKEFLITRKILGRTQKQMAELLGTSLKTVSSYEQGFRNIPVYIERQIYFFISRMKEINPQLKACWEVKQCSSEARKNCPSKEFDLGKMCWFISGTFCEKCRYDSAAEKLSMCRKCEAFQPISKIMDSYAKEDKNNS